MPVTVPKKDIWKAVRAKCLDCCCGQQTEVDQCPVTKCPLWLYRYGKSMQAREKYMERIREKRANSEQQKDDALNMDKNIGCDAEAEMCDTDD